jgi:anti-anti-sigma factor
MIDRECLVGPAVVVLPDEIDILSAGSVGERLMAAIVPGVAVVIADLTGTTFCDCAGVNTLLLASRKARASNAELRLVVRSRVVLRILELLGTDQVLPVYPDLGMALAHRLAAVLGCALPAGATGVTGSASALVDSRGTRTGSKRTWRW